METRGHGETVTRRSGETSRRVPASPRLRVRRLPALHVGAEYFDGKGTPFEPTKAKPGFGDQGGNKLTLSLLINGQLSQLFQFGQGKPGNLHGYWDSQTVTNAFGSTPDEQVADDLAKSEPQNWKLNSPVENWAEKLANEMMPLAREAHERLEFKNIKTETGSADILSGDAAEKKNSGGLSYEKWASQTVKDEIHKAGWRLAALLEEALLIVFVRHSSASSTLTAA